MKSREITVPVKYYVIDEFSLAKLVDKIHGYSADMNPTIMLKDIVEYGEIDLDVDVKYSGKDELCIDEMEINTDLYSEFQLDNFDPLKESEEFTKRVKEVLDDELREEAIDED
jgi:hypothetical protein